MLMIPAREAGFTGVRDGARGGGALFQGVNAPLTPKCDGSATGHIMFEGPCLRKLGLSSSSIRDKLELEPIRANPPKGGDAKLPV